MARKIAQPGSTPAIPDARSFEINSHGHVVLDVTSTGISGPADLAVLDWCGYVTTNRAASLLVSREYEEYHVLSQGEYRIALMPGWEIRELKSRLSAHCLKRGEKLYRYERPTANVITLVQRVLSIDDLRRLGFLYIVALHRPIEDYSGCESQMQIYRALGGIATQPSSPWRKWREETAFAFIVP